MNLIDVLDVPNGVRTVRDVNCMYGCSQCDWNYCQTWLLCISPPGTIITKL